MIITVNYYANIISIIIIIIIIMALNLKLCAHTNVFLRPPATPQNKKRIKTEDSE